MLAQTVRESLQGTPFVPFAIQMNDGRKFVIKHPDFADVSPKGTTVTVYSNDDGATLLSSILIASVEMVKNPPGRKSKKSGK